MAETIRRIRIAMYLNQFFAGLGGEDQAGMEPRLIPGPVGPGRLLQALLGDQAEIVGTLVCGDNRFAEHEDESVEQLIKLAVELRPDVVLAGPAFSSGRNGLACGRFGQEVQRRLGIPALTGLHPENPAVDLYRRELYIVPTESTARGMEAALQAIAPLLVKLGTGQQLGPPEAEGYLSRFEIVNEFADQPGAVRAVDLLLRKLRGEPFESEIVVPRFEPVEAAPALRELTRATIALATEGGVVPRGNPDRIEAVHATKWGRYSLADVTDLTPDRYECIHSGFDNRPTNGDPDRMVPVDALRSLEADGVIGRVAPELYSACGALATLSRARRFAREMAEHMSGVGVDGVILTAT